MDSYEKKHYIYIYIVILILASVNFLFAPFAFFLSLLPWRSVGRSNFDWGLQKLNNVDSNNDIKNYHTKNIINCGHS